MNSAKIQDDQKSKINMLVEYLQNNPAAKVKVTGYADVNTGNPKINKTLSENAANVAEVLKTKGITLIESLPIPKVILFSPTKHRKKTG